MILKYYGANISINSIQKVADTSKQGITLKEISDILSILEMENYAVRLHIDELDRIPHPIIIHLDGNHFVVLYKCNKKNNKYKIADPAKGKYTISYNELKERWANSDKKGVALFIAPSDNFSIKNIEHSYYKKTRLTNFISTFLSKFKANFFTLCAFTGLILIGDIITPFVFQNTIDNGIQQKDINLIFLLIFAQLGIFCGSLVSNIIIQVYITKFGNILNLKLTSTYFTNLISFPLSFFDKKSNADIIQKIDDHNRLKDFILAIPQSIFLISLNLIVFSIILCWYSYKIFIVSILFSLISVLWAVLFSSKRKIYDSSLFNLNGSIRNLTYELINGIIDIKAHNIQNNIIQKWIQMQTNFNNISLKSMYINITSTSGQNLLIKLQDLTILGICGFSVTNNYMSFGAMMTICYLVGRLSVSVNNITANYALVQYAKQSFNRVEEALTTEPTFKSTELLRPINNSIILDHIYFKYPGATSPFVLKDLSVSIRECTTTAIVGESGSGKSTLLKLILGFYHPSQGSLKLGGIEKSKLDIDSWITLCSVVLQNGCIFSDTILNNITLHDPNPNIQRVYSVLKQVGLLDFVNSLPLNIYTLLGNSGLEISGGQKQRFLIARALYKDSPIIILDEATSSLDSINERNIIDTIINSNKHKTIIISAHRLSTIKNADTILVIKNGQIAEKGSHTELLARKGEYHRLIKHQI